MINCWVNIDFDEFCSWELIVPINEITMLQEFTEKFLTLGLTHGVFILSLDEDLYKANSASDIYINAIQEKYTKNKVYDSIQYSNYNLSSQSRYFFYNKSVIICYDKDGNIGKYFSRNPGSILKTINPGLQEGNESYSYMSDLPHVQVRLIQSNLALGKVRILISLQSTIFFPWINGVFNVCKDLKSNNGLIDNTELAKLNSDIFNGWFMKLKN